MGRLLRGAVAMGLPVAVLAGCGSSGSPSHSTTAAVQTTTSAGGQGGQGSTKASTTPRSASTTTSSSASSDSSPSSSGGSEAPASSTQGTTRKAPEPAFTEGTGSAASADLREAEQTLASHGYTAGEPAQFHEHQTLEVLVGTRSGSSDGYGQQAFFFIDGRFLGTDASEPSATVKVVSQGETEVTLGYPLYLTGDALGAPSGGQATVRFQLDNGKLQALGAIPSASPSAVLSRR